MMCRLQTPEGRKDFAESQKYVRIQNSVFECVVDEAQFVLLRDRLKKEIAPEQDSLRFYRLGNNYKDKVEHYGVKREISVDEPLIL